MKRASNAPGPDKASLVLPGLLLAALLVLALLVLLLPARMVLAQESGGLSQAEGTTSLPITLKREGWRLLGVPGKAEARFSAENADRIQISAENAVGFLYRPVATDMGEKRKLAWRWRVDRAVPATDLSRAGEDDRSLAIHVVFPARTEGLSFWERLDLTLTGAVAPPLAGSVLTYVWGGTHEPGAMMTNPYFDERGRIIVLRSSDAPIGRWVVEEIDFIADFERAFGYRPEQPLFVAISADSDDTGSRSLGTVAGLSFSS